MASYSFNVPQGMTLSQFYDLVDTLAQGAGITLDSGTFYESDGQFHLTQSPDLTAPQVNAIQSALNAWVYVDYAALSQTAKPSAQAVIADIETLYDAAVIHYTALTGPDKQAIFNTLTTTWNTTATAAQKADALRSLLSLVVIAIYFIYLSLINGNEA
jgi:hypothetical protein